MCGVQACTRHFCGLHGIEAHVLWFLGGGHTWGCHLLSKQKKKIFLENTTHNPHPSWSTWFGDDDSPYSGRDFAEGRRTHSVSALLLVCIPEAFVPCRRFYDDTVGYFDIQRLGGLSSHLRKTYKGEKQFLVQAEGGARYDCESINVGMGGPSCKHTKVSNDSGVG